MLFAVAQAQVPRGESVETLLGDETSILGVLFIFAVIAIFSSFKRSKAEGLKVLSFCIGVILLVIFVPKVGMVVVGLLGLIVAWGLFRSMM